MTVRKFPITALAAACLSFALLQFLPFTADAQTTPALIERDSVEVHAPTGVDIKTVHIENRLGDVSVRGHDKQVISIQSIKRADTPETMERLVVKLVPDANGNVQINTILKAGTEQRPVATHNIAVDLIVFVPRKARLKAELWNGNLVVRTIDNGADLVVDRGNIDVALVSGRINSDIRRGSQEFSQVFGELAASGIEGDMALHKITGPHLTARLVRGDITGKDIKVDRMNVQSVFGDIALTTEFMASGTYRISSRRGNIRLFFHSDNSLNLQVLAQKVTLDPSLHAKKGTSGQWEAHWQFSPNTKHIQPGKLEIRALSGAVLVKHF